MFNSNAWILNLLPSILAAMIVACYTQRVALSDQAATSGTRR
jgi:hypothetical protein